MRPILAFTKCKKNLNTIIVPPKMGLKILANLDMPINIAVPFFFLKIAKNKNQYNATTKKNQKIAKKEQKNA